MKRVKWLLFILLGGFGFVFLQWPDGKMHLVFCDVGQGDSALIVKGNFQAVIDTGPSIDKFDNCFNRYVPFWDREIEVLYISHGHDDHAGALKEIKSRYVVKKLMDKTDDNDLVRYGSLYIDTLVGNVANKGVAVLGSSTDNDSSVILGLKYGNFTTLFTSDIDEQAELALIDRGVLSKVDVLKVAHHGSKYGSTDAFLTKIEPEVAIVSVGAKNSYGHPNGDTLLRLDRVGAKVFRTDKQGDIEIVVDGEDYVVKHDN